jgi:hypothetical protein
MHICMNACETLAARNESVFQNPRKVVFRSGLESRDLLCLSASVSLDECVKRDGQPSLVFVNKR